MWSRGSERAEMKNAKVVYLILAKDGSVKVGVTKNLIMMKDF